MGQDGTDLFKSFSLEEADSSQQNRVSGSSAENASKDRYADTHVDINRQPCMISNPAHSTYLNQRACVLGRKENIVVGGGHVYCNRHVAVPHTQEHQGPALLGERIRIARRANHNVGQLWDYRGSEYQASSPAV